MIFSGKTPGGDKQASYASIDDFAATFTKNMPGLYGLAFLLTGDQQEAEKVFAGGLEDAVKDNKVFKEWAYSWAKRTIIQNAIREVKPRPANNGFAIDFASTKLPIAGAQFHLAAILALDDFERFVFVMSVLEHYSEYECALLLGSTRQHVREGRARAVTQLRGMTQAFQTRTANDELSMRHSSVAVA